MDERDARRGGDFDAFGQSPGRFDVGQVDQWTGRGYELDSIVAAVMGGVAITGGRGHIFGALLGVLILIVMFNAVILLGLPVQIQLILKGVIVIAASALYLSDGGERT